MKKSTIIIIGIITLLNLGVFATNYILKKEYDRVDKADKYYNYNTISNQPFKHLVINGYNKIKVKVEPNEKSSVKILKWVEDEFKNIEKRISGDTLYFNISDTTMNKFLKSNTYHHTMPIVIIQTPEVISMWGSNCLLDMKNMNQNNYTISLTGNSNVKLESKLDEINNLDISLEDSSFFELNNSEISTKVTKLNSAKVTLKNTSSSNFSQTKISNLNLNLEETSSIALSGYNLNKISANKN